jgi:CO dehydrogenase maturation factor
VETVKISVCGKGGSGKSTVVTLLAKSAQLRGIKAIVVDSDESNSGLYRMLGFDQPPLPLMELVGGKQRLKEKMGQSGIFVDMQIPIDRIPSQHILQKNGLMLVSIGKILQVLEGCACPMGVLSREFVKKLRLGENEIAVIDMEAGVEHFGRGIDGSIDAVILVVEPSWDSVTLAKRIKGLAEGIEKKVWAVLNKVDSESIATRLRGELKQKGIEVIGVLPYDAYVSEACLEGRALDRGEALQEAGKALDFLLSN